MVEERDESGEARLNLTKEELSLMRDLLFEVKAFIKAPAIRKNGLEVLLRWFSFINKTEIHDPDALKKMEKVFYFKSRTRLQGLDLWHSMRTRFPDAKYEDWRLLLDRMSDVSYL